MIITAITTWQFLIKLKVGKSFEINAYVLSNISGYVIMSLLILPVYLVQFNLLLAGLFSFILHIDSS